ncbi:MAG: hypothetical protein AAFZ52_17515, partial [Bacteroidota bacterium]
MVATLEAEGAAFGQGVLGAEAQRLARPEAITVEEETAAESAVAQGALDLNWRKGKFNTFAGLSGRYDER